MLDAAITWPFSMPVLFRTSGSAASECSDRRNASAKEPCVTMRIVDR